MEKMNYKTIDDKDIEFLVSFCDEERVIVKDSISEDYSRDEMTPEELR